MNPQVIIDISESDRTGDSAIRLVEERDIPAIAELFRANYGEDYAYPDVYDGGWVKRCIYSETANCLVLEADGQVVGTGSLVLSYGDRNDRSGELARLVIAPRRSGHGLGDRLIQGLFEVAANSVDFATGEARTAHPITQEMVEDAEFSTIGFIPQFHNVKKRRESQVLYAKLYGDGAFLRTGAQPWLIPEAIPLARLVHGLMGLSGELVVSNDAVSDHDPDKYLIRLLDRSSIGPLLRIPFGRVTDPLLFGNLSIDQGFTYLRDKAQYFVAFDEQDGPVGAVGVRYDATNRLSHAVELVATNRSVWPALCRRLVEASEECGAEVVCADVSAYQPHLQRILYDLGFRPAAYAPAMVFHETERLDVIKMVKLNVPFDPGPMKLTEPSQKMVDLVEAGFRI